MEDPGISDLSLNNPLHRELYFLIVKFLGGGPCRRAVQALAEEIEENEILPKSVNWLGDPVSLDLRSFSSKYEHVDAEHLPHLLEQLLRIVNTKESSHLTTSRSLLSRSTLAALQRNNVSEKHGSLTSWSKRSSLQALLRTRPGQPPPPGRLHHVYAVTDRALSGTSLGNNLVSSEFFTKMRLAHRTMGHLAAVYCVLFDVSGKYIFTGADDKLVKVWSAIDGRLLFTYRGSMSEVQDMAVNYENTMLAVAEKCVRVWCLRTGAPIATLVGQAGCLSTIFFCPMPRSKSSIRYLASTSSDGSCAFWAYNDEPGEPIVFQPKPTLYQERMRPGNAKMLCASFSSGGIFMAAGSADCHVRVYYMLGSEGPERILEVEHHSDNVDSLAWAHEGVRFVTGSKDGTALIWRFENACWRYIRLNCSKSVGESVVVADVHSDPKRRPKVDMVSWNSDDSIVLTFVSDFTLRAWNSRTGELIRYFEGHTNNVYSIESHPYNPQIVATAGHDGKLIIWNIGTTDKSSKSGKIFFFENQLEGGQGFGSLFDSKWSQDGFTIAATDSHGHLLHFTIEGDKHPKFKNLPTDLFFHTDYRPLQVDAISQEVVDEQTQVAPHLMPPPFLVNVDGNPYPPELQRLVPGRENMKEDSLIPIVAVSERGVEEVIEGIPARSNIDEMIQQLARAQGLQAERNAANAGQPREAEHRGIGHRRSGEVEGVRRSGNLWNASSSSGSTKRAIVQPQQLGALDSAEEKRLGLTEAEEAYYYEHLAKFPEHTGSASAGIPAACGSPVETTEGRSRRLRRLAAQAAERRQLHQEDNAVEGIARPNPRPELEISVLQERRPAQRRMPRPITPRRADGQAHANRLSLGHRNRRSMIHGYNVRRIMDINGVSDLENMDLEDSSSEASISESSSSSDSETSDSDWGGNLGAGQRRRQQQEENRSGSDSTRPARASARKKSRSSDESEAVPDESPIKSEASASAAGEPRPGPSSEITGKGIKTEPIEKVSRPRKSKAKVDYSSGFEEIDPAYRPSEWLCQTKPIRSPYFPQLGDELVYFRQGHAEYIKYVEESKVYPLNNKVRKSLPYVTKPDLEPEVSVRVVGIRFEIEPPRVAVLKLARTDWNTGELIRNEHLYVKYHDVANVVDFLVLRQMYNKAIRRKWNEGDRFRCLINTEWWLGSVVKHEPLNQDYPESHFMSYKVKWDNGDPEKMSPWDMEDIPDDFVVPENSKDGIEATDGDIMTTFYEPSTSDWPPHGHQAVQCEKLSRLMEQVMELAVSDAFATPVDLTAYPDYAQTIEYFIDLSTIKDRLDNKFYRRKDAVKFDFQYIATNAEKYNQEGSEIVRRARVLRDLCNELLQNPDVTSVTPLYQNINKKYGPVGSGTAEPSNSRKAATKASSQSKKSTSSSSKSRSKAHHGDDSEEEDERDWAELCLELLNTIYHKKDAVPFREPVDIIEYPDYYQVIDTPMDLGAVREDLLGGNYNSVHDFHKDMMLIFSNSKQYNEERSAIYAMTCRLQALYECQIKPILRRGKRKTRSRRGDKKSSRRQAPSSATSSPRKNPKRSAASKSQVPDLSDETDDDHEEQQKNFAHMTRSTRRRGSFVTDKAVATNGTSRRGGSNTVNGHSSFSTPTPGTSRSNSTRNSNSTEGSEGRAQPRRVKRLRISSGEGENESPRASPPRKLTKTDGVGTRSSPRKSKPILKHEPNSDSDDEDILPTRSSPRKYRVAIKDEPGSEESGEENASMPRLKRQRDKDYEASDNDDSANEYNVRRSGRVSRRHYCEEEEHAYGTRNRGKSTRSYVEDDEDEDDGSFGKRRKVVLTSSPNRNTRSHGTAEPPVLRRREIHSEDEEEDVNQPGPSRRMMRTPQKHSSPTASPARSTRQTSSRSKHDEDDEEEAEDYDEESEDEDEDEENSDESDDQEADKGKGGRAGVRQTNRRPLRPKQNISDDEDYEDEGSGRRPKRSRKPVQRLAPGTNRRTRGNRPDYAEEESDSEPTKITVSMRGRVRRTKSFLGD